MDPGDILQRLADRYSQCRSYSDSGMASFNTVQNKQERIDFRTRFIRPDYFCFEWQDYGPRRGKSEEFSMIWSNTKEIVRSSPHGLEQVENLRMAIAGATGSSAGAAHIVSSLLFDEVRSNSKNILNLVELEVLREEVLEGQNAYVLRGSLFKKGDHLLWVSTNDFSLVRVLQDKSRTAAESKSEHEAFLANKELMARLSERGIAPPLEMQHADCRYCTDYTYSNLSFDASISPLPRPTSI